MKKTQTNCAIILLLQSFATVGFTQSLPPGLPTVDSARADAVVTFDTKTGVFSYSYRVANSTASAGSLDHFYIDISTTSNIILTSSGLVNSATGYAATQKISELNARTLAGSIVPVGLASQPAGWIVGLDADMHAFWSSDLNASEIAPGQSINGFSMQSPAIPGIRRFDVGAYFEPGLFYPGIDEVATDTEALKITNQENAAALACLFKGMTIGPVSPPSLKDVAELLGFLAGQKEQAAGLGWIRGDEYIKNLDEKLEQAQKALADKHDLEARKKLEQFIQKIEDQRRAQTHRHHGGGDDHGQGDDRDGWRRDEGDKTFLSGNAYYLLKPNAEYILSKLPKKPGEGDDRGSGDDGAHRR